MNKDNKNHDKTFDKYHVEATFSQNLDSHATTDCTGLIPSLPQTQEELDSYKSLIPFSPDDYVEKTSSK